MTIDWFDGAAKVITALGGAGGFVAACGAWWQANRAAKIAAEHTPVLAEQTVALARVEKNGDGVLSASLAVAKKLGIQKDALAIEVERRDAGGGPTPQGPPSAGVPVGMVDGHAKAYAPPPGEQPRPDRGDLSTDESGP